MAAHQNDVLIRELISLGEHHVTKTGAIWKHVPSSRRRPFECWRRCEYPHDGYLRIKHRKHQLLAHRVVFQALIGNLNPDLQINHRNGIKVDNRPGNLEQVECVENVRHAVATGLIRPERCHTAKMNWVSVRELRRRRANGESLKSLALEFNVTTVTVSHIARGESWKE